ncbi:MULTISPECIES: PhoH family protein [unclassified Lentimicrobium]|uniref:PhoH family protein n=1 Tax=unclassified Lentimicrobium TaxID=2677434 RepID=UPI0015575076|nr:MULTISPECIES: PhoH family protein [unclassified Lentimicrobium]NPD47769.1 PhoH family protein [Lentimicrobium sp. S6]NPD86658.1 PhoH family protein [Lentimicrobium sp. L6]
MAEKVLSLEPYHPLDIFGVNEVNLNTIKEIFPSLRFVVRGDVFKIFGNDEMVIQFEKFFDVALMHFEKFNKLNPQDLKGLMHESASEFVKGSTSGDDILVHGVNGKLIKALTVNQRKLVETSMKNDLVFAIGPAGSGKTYTAVALAVRALKNKEVKRIILARPAVEAGESLGFLPGDMKEKLDPYMMPLYDALRDMLPAVKLEKYLEDGTIEIAPLAFMRGRTLNNAYAILDEAQNATSSQLKMFLTRMGVYSKFFVTGDITQIDLPRKYTSGLKQAQNMLKDIKGVDFVHLNDKDIVRHSLVTSIIKAYQLMEDEEEQNRKEKKQSSI